LNPAQHDISYYRGATDLLTMQWKSGGAAVDLTGYTVAMFVKTQAGLVAASSGAGISAAITTATGTVSFTISDAVGQAMPLGVLRYDIWAVSSGGIDYPLLSGNFTVSEEVRNV